MNNKNIIQVTAYYPPHLGGMENCAKEISNILSKKFNVSVYTSNIGVKNMKTSKNSKVKYLNSFEVAHTPIIFSLFQELLKIPKNSIIHLHISQAFTPEIVYLVFKLKKIPYIAHFHLDIDASGKIGILLKPYKKYFLSRVLRNASNIICLSLDQRKFVHDKYKIPLSKISIVPNGVSKEFFINKKYSKKKLSNILFVGRLVDQKNIPLLINALSLVQNQYKLDIVGDGDEMNNIKNLINDSGLKNIKLHGKKTGKDLISFYKNADLFVIPSKKEGISLSMLEAMAAGLPIISSASSGNEIIKDSGVILKSDTPKELAREIDKLMSNSKKMKNYSKNSIKTAKEYSWNKATQKIEDIYSGVSI